MQDAAFRRLSNWKGVLHLPSPPNMVVPVDVLQDVAKKGVPGLGQKINERQTLDLNPYNIYLDLIQAVEVPQDHFERISDIIINYVPSELKTEYSPDDIKTAGGILSRMPALPQGLLDTSMWIDPTDSTPSRKFDRLTVPDKWLDKYLCSDSEPYMQRISATKADPYNIQDWKLYHVQVWQNLQVTNSIDPGTTIVALGISKAIAFPNLDLARKLVKYINLLAEVINALVKMQDIANTFVVSPQAAPNDVMFKKVAADNPRIQAFVRTQLGSKQQITNHLIVKTFLWTAWQRSATLLFYYVLGVQVAHGYSSEWNSTLALKGVDGADKLSAELDEERSSTKSLAYICNRSFEVFRSGRAGLLLDFRRLFARFALQFSKTPARCGYSVSWACDGFALPPSNAVSATVPAASTPYSCKRFVAQAAPDQSMHDEDCERSKCKRLKWNEATYRKAQSPRAVAVSPTGPYDSHKILYCTANSATIAISHVWSHGQGGRPEDGVNLCLHRRYSRLARQYGCNSYWIDSACIPEDDILRKEAIMKINWVFQNSKMTLVCDKDIMSIDISSGDVVASEVVLATLLLCDWNTRAWTLLEAVKGSSNLHLLCKNTQIVPLQSLIRHVFAVGSVDLVILLHAAQHLIPRSRSSPAFKGFEEGGYLLSQRYASRPGDDVIIWSLLKNDIPYKTVSDLITNQANAIRTGFLMSSSPRLDVDGWRWAPSGPWLRLIDNGIGNLMPRGLHAYDGEGSLVGRVSKEGLKATWLMHVINTKTGRESIANFNITGPTMLIEEYRKIGLQSWNAVLDHLAQSQRHRLAFLKALAADGVRPYDGSGGRGDIQTADSPFVVLCTSLDGKTWTWVEACWLKQINAEIVFTPQEIILK